MCKDPKTKKNIQNMPGILKKNPSKKMPGIFEKATLNPLRTFKTSNEVFLNLPGGSPNPPTIFTHQKKHPRFVFPKKRM